MSRAITFKEIREYCSRFEKVEICIAETLEYKVYENILAVPEGEYDDLYLYGFGTKEVDYHDQNNKLSFLPGMQIMLSEKPRDDIEQEEIKLKEV